MERDKAHEEKLLVMPVGPPRRFVVDWEWKITLSDKGLRQYEMFSRLACTACR